MELKPYQKEGVALSLKFLKERGCVYNGSEPGTGKSAMTLDAINLLPDILSTLIISPAIGRLVWEDQINLWSNKHSQFTVISYDTARTKTSLFKNLDYQCLVIDEAHFIKTPSAKRTKAILQELWPKARYKICLSGTPFTKAVSDCWTLFSRMAPEDFGDWWRFVNTYTHVKNTPFGRVYEGIKNAEKLKKITRSKFFFRYKLSEANLPEKHWQKIPLPISYKHELTPQEEKEMAQYIELLKDAYVKGTFVNKAPPISSTTIARLQGKKKVPAIVEFCKNLLDQELSVVVFGYFKETIAEIQKALIKYEPVVITGDTSDKDRKLAIDRFQAKETKLFIGNMIAAGISCTLTAAYNVVFAEWSWNPDQISQSVNRCQRIGQKHTVNCYYFSVKGSIDEKMMDTVLDKVKTFQKVLG